MKTLKLALYLTALTVIPVVAIWLPFLTRAKSVIGVPIPAGGMQTVAANYDGPLYIAVAKSFYNLNYIRDNFSFPIPLEYYAAHFPMYPVLIRLFSFPIGYPWGMLLATLLSSLLCITYFYFFIKKYVNEKDAIWLIAVFAILPARWLIVRAVGSPEPLFVGAILASIYHFDKKQYWLAGFWGAIAQLTKSPGILLFAAYGGTLLLSKIA